jgi:hypothetical protein
MQFKAHEYYAASTLRSKQARKLYAEGEDYALAMYCAGLAVECLLRAFRWVEDESFEGRHDLAELLKASGFLKTDEEFMRRKGASDDQIQSIQAGLRGAMNEVVVLWHNNLRFADNSGLKAHLRRIGRLKGKGDPLKRNALHLIEAAQTILDRGTTLWALKRKSSGP